MTLTYYHYTLDIFYIVTDITDIFFIVRYRSYLSVGAAEKNKTFNKYFYLDITNIVSILVNHINKGFEAK